MRLPLILASRRKSAGIHAPPAQVAALRKLLPTTGQDPETLSACFGRKNKKRTDQITGILATLKALGHIG